MQSNILSMRYLTADQIFTDKNNLEADKVLVVAEDGEIMEVLDRDFVDSSAIQAYKGILVPGLINTHCHLELSDMYSKIPMGKGLVGFIESVNQLKFDKKEINRAVMQEADQSMYEAGIVAVADISNGVDTIDIKMGSSMFYHTLIEIMGVDGSQASKRWQEGKKIFQAFEEHGLESSMTLHAPYSCSVELFHLLMECDESGHLFSIHNLECADERKLYFSENNNLKVFLKSYIKTEYRLPEWQQSTMSFYTKLLDDSKNKLLVHNTYMSSEDLDMLDLDKYFFCTCPNANLYIENRLPDYKTWIEKDCKVTIGTDSLASNHELSIWSEIKTILNHTDIALATLLQWATINGALYMELEDDFGSFSKGKKPGVVLLEGDVHKLGSLACKRLF